MKIKNLEEAKTDLIICKELFSTFHDAPYIGIGNMGEHEYDEAVERVIEYFKNNPDFVNIEENPEEYIKDPGEFFMDKAKDRRRLSSGRLHGSSGYNRS